MLIDRGVEERVINHWDHRIELGTSWNKRKSVSDCLTV